MTNLAPVSVALKFGFLAVLYVFLLWVARSAMRDLRAGRVVAVHGKEGEMAKVNQPLVTLDVDAGAPLAAVPSEASAGRNAPPPAAATSVFKSPAPPAAATREDHPAEPLSPAP